MFKATTNGGKTTVEYPSQVKRINHKPLLAACTLSLALTLAACGGGSGGTNDDDDDINVGPQTDTITTVTDGELVDGMDDSVDIVECSIADQNRRVDFNMRDYYLWYDQVPQVNLADYDSPSVLIRDLRVQEFDSFSFVTDLAQSVETVEQGRNYALGFNFRFDAAGDARVIMVDPNGPAFLAGLKRGDIVVSFSGTAVRDLTQSSFDEIVGPRENPNSVDLEIIDGSSGESVTLTMAAAEFDIASVLFDTFYTHPEYDGRIGYLIFTQFIETSDVELDEAFARLAEENVTDLVVDLRYNGGGRTRIARKLASLIASPATDGELLIEYRLNDKYEEFNFERIFEPEANALGLQSVVFITTGATASSSEIVINSLKPYINVRTVGTTTVGKPYISAPRDFCGIRMNALEGEGFNANGVSVVGGIPADCFAQDDISADWGIVGDNPEPMLLAAADSIVFGTCETPDTTIASREAGKQTEMSYQPVQTAEETVEFMTNGNQ